MGFYGPQHALKAHKWTAAALSVGLLPFQSLVVLSICGIAGVVIAKRQGLSAAGGQ